MIDWLLRIDEKLFFAINNGWGSPLTDGVMTLASVAGDFGVLFPFGLLFILLWAPEKKGGQGLSHLL